MTRTVVTPDLWRSIDVTRRSLLPTAALALLTVTAVMGLQRLVVSRQGLWAVAGAAIAIHGLAWGARRSGLAASLQAALLLPVTVWVAGIIIAPDTLLFGLPTGDTVAVLRADLSMAVNDFRAVTPPAPFTDGIRTALVLIVCVLAWAADIVAFRLRGTIESAVPALAIFIAGSMLDRSGSSPGAALSFAAAAGAYLVCHQIFVRGESLAWFGGVRSSTVPLSVAVGVSLASVAALVGATVGPALPGASETALVDWRSATTGTPDRSTVSPIVDLRGRLVEQRDTVVFTVDASQSTYWRLTALDRFDGTVWSSDASYRRTEGSLGPDATTTSSAQQLEQQFEIRALTSLWLPVAYRPNDVEGLDPSYDQTTASLISRNPTTDGLRYQASSDLPEHDVDSLRTATNRSISSDDPLLELPELNPEIALLAQQITADATTPYDKARALQDWFRTNFIYDLDIEQGHDLDALSNFLFETRRGYCEQFAGAFAVMARSVGIPSRVAVGFTPGEREGTRYTVRDRNAHAWPEVFLDEFGWISFEPTPGRGQPGAEPWTGVPAQQDETEPEPSPPVTVTVTTQVQSPSGTTATSAAGTQPSSAAVGGQDETMSPWLVVVALFALAALAIAGLRWRTTRHHRRTANTPTDRVLLDWLDIEDALRRCGTRRQASETAREFAVRVAQLPPNEDHAPPQLVELSDTVARLVYDDHAVPDDDELAQSTLGRTAAITWSKSHREFPLVGAVTRRFGGAG